MATAQQAVSKARSQVGTTEVGSSNKVKFNDWYWGKGKQEFDFLDGEDVPDPDNDDETEEADEADFPDDEDV